MFETANYIEAALWIGIGLGFLASSMFRSSDRRVFGVAAFTFLLFGVSDIIEVQTGAWWRPWWLFAWKGVCVLLAGYLLVIWLRRRKLSCANCGHASVTAESVTCPECGKPL